MPSWSTMFAALWLALIASVAASPTNTTTKFSKRTDGKVLIGYRAVNQMAMTQYSLWGNTIRWIDQGHLEQTGPGVYLAFNMADWVSDYFCAVFADETAFSNANKMWLPYIWTLPPEDEDEEDEFESDCEQRLLWYNAYRDEPQRPPFIAANAPRGYTEANTMLISTIAGAINDIEQLLIPPSLASEDNPLGLSVQCQARTSPDLVYAIWNMYGPVQWRNAPAYSNVVQAADYPAPAPPPVAGPRPSLEYSKIVGQGLAVPGSPDSD